MSRRLLFVAIAAAVGVLIAVLLLLPRFQAPRVVQRDVSDAIYATLQREADTTFVVTGYLDVFGTVRSEDTQILLPNLLDLRLGTTSATVRVPGRVAYGFDIGQLQPSMIRARGDTIELEIPIVTVFSVEPDLSRLEAETRTGWSRLPASAQITERRATQLINQALRQQADRHLESSIQPQVNTARALRRMVEPIASQLGLETPHFRVYLGEGLLLEP